MTGTGPAQAPAETAAADRPRWLSAEEQRTWLALLAAINQLDADLDRQLQRDSGLSHPYYMVLAALSESADRRMRMSDLATINHASQSRLTHAVNRLVAEGWVRREKCDGDRRVVYAVLTDEGFEVLRAAAPGHVEAVREFLFDQLTPDQVRQLREISEKLVAGRSSTFWPSPQNVRDPIGQDDDGRSGAMSESDSGT